MKKKVFFISVTLLLLLSGMMVAVGGEAIDGGASNSETDIFMVSIEEKNDVTSIETTGGEILERYPERVLVEMSQDTKFELEEDGHIIENLENRDYIGLQSYSFNADEGTPDIPDNLEIESYPEDETGYYIVQFIGPIRTEWKQELEKEGIEFHQFRHRYNYIVEMDSEIKRNVEEKYFVNWVGTYQPAYRFDRELLKKSGEQIIEVSFFDGVDLKRSAKQIESLGGNIQDIRRNRITTEVHTERMERIPNLKGVNSITESVEEYRVYNDDATWITQTNVEDNRKVTEAGVTGQDQIITVMDSELYGGDSDDPDHEMWEDPDGNPVGGDHRKIQEHYVPDTSGGDLNDGMYHGTHVVGSVLGDSSSYGEYDSYDGNALESRLIFQDVDHDDQQVVYPPIDMSIYAWGPSYESESRVHSNSFGGGDGYGEDAINADQFIRDHKDYNILYAMGNDGPGSNTLSEQAEGKNVISVGSVVNYPDQDEVSTFSSRGYADDGRIKPTIMHVGEGVWSAERSYDGYQSKSGTSMATPGIAGQVGQVREYYEEGWYVDGTPNPDEGFNPSNALIRATLINGAVEITGDGSYHNDNRFPNGDQGFGRSKLDRVLHFEGDERNLIAYDSWNEGVELDTGESWDIQFSVDDPTQELEVTLAWSDYPGEAGADENDPAIVNDLDLELTDPKGDRYVGNAFTGHNPGYSEPNPTDNPWSGQRDGEFDGLNVEENILLLPDENEIETGNYKLTVSAHQVPEGYQPFAVVISGSGVEEVGEDWYYRYDTPYRSDADNALGLEEEGVWQGAIRLELPPGEITDIAYYNWNQPYSVKGEIYTDGGNEPDELIAETEEYEPPESDGWKEIPLIDPATIYTDYYWIVLEIHDPGTEVYPFGIIENYIRDGGWIHVDGDTWETLPEIDQDNSWALEVRVEEAPVFVSEDWLIDSDSVDAGETLSIEGNIENIGGESGDGTVELYIDDEFIDSKNVSNLDPGDNENVNFQHSEENAGNYDVQVETDADQWTSELEVEPGDPDFVDIDTESNITTTAGKEENFSATAYDEYENLITNDDADFSWENANETGIFEEIETGKYEVQAIYEGVFSELTTVTVEPAGVDYVIIDPFEDKTIDSGDTIEFSAEAYDEYDNLITDDDTDFTWENADSSGTFDETDAGNYEVRATYDGESSESLTVTVETFWSNYWWLIVIVVIAAVIVIGIAIAWKKERSPTYQPQSKQRFEQQQPRHPQQKRQPPPSPSQRGNQQQQQQPQRSQEPQQQSQLFHQSQQRAEQTPPPPPKEKKYKCPACGQEMRFIDKYHRWYCDRCEEYKQKF